ncbi:MAG TPA: GntR family transcriptional regulator [Gemmatimonas sp.]|uniref:GntR family transcriptional regulator n=1 Tax=Gemmatimonas sp. TaxID=1962908 RepID=UPI002ED8F705
MLSFPVTLVAGQPPFRQVVYAATRAIVSGQLAAGASFPSVRDISQSLKINPNTAHKVVLELTRMGLLEVRPGVGTVVAPPVQSSPQTRAALLADQTEALVVEAMRLGLTRDELLDALRRQWDALS